jgi:hypothetical protein
MQTQSHAAGRPEDVEPYLSVVVTARNDDHGGNPLYRMQLFVNGLIAQCDRHRLPAELVIVEWNPPVDRPSLASVLDWPESAGWCDVRIVEVPEALHTRLEHADRLPLFQMIGKNVGIRRARGAFVLATNIDILFPDALIEFIARQELDPERVYRVDRVDVPAEIDPSWSMDEQLLFCRDNAIRANYYDATVDLRTGERYRIYHDVPWLLRFLPASIQSKTRLARYILWRIYAFFFWIWCGLKEPRLIRTRLGKRWRRMVAAGQRDLHALPGAVAHAPTPSSILWPAKAGWRLVRRFGRHLRDRSQAFMRAVEWEKARIRLHTNASGDFTLMSKEAWLRTRGYAELEMYSMHIDGLQLYQAHYSGIREKRLREPAYHIEHGGGFKPGSRVLDERLAREAIPQITNAQLMEWIYEMYVTKRPIAFNRPDWGLAEEPLPETAPLARPPIVQTHTEVA